MRRKRVCDVAGSEVCLINPHDSGKSTVTSLFVTVAVSTATALVAVTAMFVFTGACTNRSSAVRQEARIFLIGKYTDPARRKK